MKCYECRWLDRSVILTSYPPQYGCTLGFGSHYADHECEYDFMPIIKCKDCRHADECHKSVQYTQNGLNTVTIGFSPIEWCSNGERREP
jgi:hypothetical protein